MRTPLSGTPRGGLTLYDGRAPLGFICSSVSGVFAHDIKGKPVGAYADQKAAQNGLRDRTASGEAGSS